jgi:hypothetical protein
MRIDEPPNRLLRKPQLPSIDDSAKSGQLLGESSTLSP